MTPRDLTKELGKMPIPTAPAEVAIGIPADLIRRRPDVRRIEREAAAQSARIGIAESEFYPAYFAHRLARLVDREHQQPVHGASFNGSAGPCSAGISSTTAGCETTFATRTHGSRSSSPATSSPCSVPRAKRRTRSSFPEVAGAREGAQRQRRGLDATAPTCSNTQYQGQMIDYTPVGYFAQNLLEQQDQAAQAQGDVALALVEIYRAIGGGWQVRLGAGSDAPKVEIPQTQPIVLETLPQPLMPTHAEDLSPTRLPAPSEPWHEGARVMRANQPFAGRARLSFREGEAPAEPGLDSQSLRVAHLGQATEIGAQSHV